MHAHVLRKTFFRFDVDQSGTISKEDLINVLGSSFEGAELEDLIKEADMDNDGVISYNEFLRYFKEEENMTPENSKLTQNLSEGLDELMVTPHESPHTMDPPAMMLTRAKTSPDGQPDLRSSVPSKIKMVNGV